MSEEAPTKAETPESRETPSEGEMRDDTARLAEELERLDPADSRIREKVEQWHDYWEGRISQENRNNRLRLYFNFQTARLYFAIGKKEDGNKALEEVIVEIDSSQNGDDLYGDIRERAWTILYGPEES
jgi:hypothetical protein